MNRPSLHFYDYSWALIYTQSSITPKRLSHISNQRSACIANSKCRIPCEALRASFCPLAYQWWRLLWMFHCGWVNLLCLHIVEEVCSSGPSLEFLEGEWRHGSYFRYDGIIFSEVNITAGTTVELIRVEVLNEKATHRKGLYYFTIIFLPIFLYYC